MAILSRNPATEEQLQRFEMFGDDRLETTIARADAVSGEYRRTSLERRAGWLRAAADLLEEGVNAYARLITTEMGKPIGQAVSEVEKCAWVCRYYAEHGADFLADEEVETEAARSLVRYLPLGPILAIMPWNFPFWQVFRFAAPGLMAGNVALLKHASSVPQCAIALEGIFRRAGFPEGAFQNLLVGTDRVAGILADPRIRAATLTGSVGAGRSVAATAGEHLKKTVLELGGSDPFIVMPTADLESALEAAVRSRTICNGQSCIAAKRFLLAEPIAEEFQARFVERMEALEIGDPLDESTELGPLAATDLLEDLEEQVRETEEAGATVLTGGHPVERPGHYYAPTVLTDIPEHSPAYRDELFGPVASLFRVRDPTDAIRLANDTGFGLGAAAWTTDTTEQERFMEELEAGTVVINGMVASDPRLPFGGVKDSGYGRELGRHGIREFVNVKTLWIRER